MSKLTKAQASLLNNLEWRCVRRHGEGPDWTVAGAKIKTPDKEAQALVRRGLALIKEEEYGPFMNDVAEITEEGRGALEARGES